MSSLRAVVIGIGAVIVVILISAIALIKMHGSQAAAKAMESSSYNGMIPAAALLRVPVTGVYPGGNPTGLNPNMQNPLANDPNAAQRGMQDFDHFNCSGCHMARGGGGMGPALSDHRWSNRESPANIYLDIAQGRGKGMPAWGAILPDKTIWELVAYIQSISQKPAPTFGATTSASPPSPDKEQVPAENMETAVPWQFTEPMPPNGEKPGSKPEKRM